MLAVQSPIIPVVADMIRDNPGTISLGQGVVSYPPPPQAIQAISQFHADAENHKYRPVGGIPPLVQALTDKLGRENGIRLGAARQVVVTAGGNMAFNNALLAVADVGDELILLTPYYFNHEMAITMAGCRAVTVATDADYQPDVGRIVDAITPRTRAVVTISPNNPTGAVYPEATLKQINALCATRGIYHIHDEAYEYFVHTDAGRPAPVHFSPGSIPGSAPHTISLFSLSKSYGFASWRIGYMVIPSHLGDAVRKIQDTILICPPVISQYAAIGALQVGSAYCREQVARLGEVRRIVLDALRETEDLLSVPQPPGAFYVLPRVRASIEPMVMVERLIREHRVAVIPGTTFGVSKPYLLRIAYGALQVDTATEGIARFTRGIRAILSAP
jgi:aspartate/methionine/tyrosine aminotransferase